MPRVYVPYRYAFALAAVVIAPGLVLAIQATQGGVSGLLIGATMGAAYLGAFLLMSALRNETLRTSREATQ